MAATEDQIALATKLLGVFRGREDVVAVQVGDGFSPEEDRAITPEWFANDHLGGKRCLGFYLISPGDTVYCAAVDFDNKPHKKQPDPEWKGKAETTSNYINGCGISTLIEVSQSGIAAHVWMFFESPTPAWLVRQFLEGVSGRLKIPFREVYPRQDSLVKTSEEKDPIGNLIRYPLWGKSKFVEVDAWQSWKDVDPAVAISQIKPTNEEDLRELCVNLGFKFQKPRTATPGSGCEPGTFSTIQGELKFDRDVEPPAEWFETLLANLSEFRSTWERRRRDMLDQTPSGYCFSIVSQLARIGCTNQQIADACIAWRRKEGELAVKPAEVIRKISVDIGKVRKKLAEAANDAPEPAAPSRIEAMISDLKNPFDADAADRVYEAIRAANQSETTPIPEKTLSENFKTILKQEQSRRANENAEEFSQQRPWSPPPTAAAPSTNGDPKWRLVIVESQPRTFRLYSPLWHHQAPNGYIELTAAQVRSSDHICDAAIDQAAVWVTAGTFKKLWNGDKTNKSLGKQLFESAERAASPLETKRDKIIGQLLYGKLEDAMTRVVGSKTSDSAAPSTVETYRGATCTTSDGSVVFGFDKVWEDMSKSEHRVKSRELTKLLADLGVRVKNFGPRKARKRYQVLSPECVRRLEGWIELDDDESDARTHENDHAEASA